MRDVQRSSTCSVERGLYVLRYVSSDSADVAPVAFVRPAEGSEGLIKIVEAPGVAPGFMAEPGSSLVVVSQAYGLLEITVRASESSRALDAKFALELLYRGEAARPAHVKAPAVEVKHPVTEEVRDPIVTPASAVPARFDVLAHVSRRGDVMVQPGDWIAGPDAPAPIEGLQIQCRGADLAVSAQFMNTSQPGVWSSWWAAGEFVGSRQQASPLTGLRLKIVGRDASRFAIEAEAMFLGAPLQRQSGAEVTLATPTGFDLLVGLKLALKPAHRQEVPAAARMPRVRVFRSDKADLVNS